MSDCQQAVRVLIIEDNADDAEFLLREFKRNDYAVDAEIAEDLPSVEAALACGTWDIVLSDYNLPGTRFSDILAMVKAADVDMPVIVVSGAVGEEVAVSLMREGANDLVLKHNLSRLVPTMTRELKAAELDYARRESERRFVDVVVASADWVWETDADHRLCFDMGGREQSEWSDPLRSLGRTHWEAVGADPETDSNWKEHKRVIDSHEPFRNFRFCFSSPKGQEYHISMSGIPTFGRSGAFTGYRGTATDETLVVETYLRAETAETQLREVVENIPRGVLVSDEQDRVAIVNEAYRDLHSELAHLLTPGTPYGKIETRAAELGVVVDDADAPGPRGRDEVPADIMRDAVWTLPDGQRVLVSENRMTNGGRVQLMMEMKQPCGA